MDIERLILALILVLAPHTKVPGSEFIYPIRPVDIVLCFAALIYLGWSLARKWQSPAALEMSIVIVISVLSTLWGINQLNQANLNFVWENGSELPYYSVAIKKVLLICVSFVGFQFVFNSRSMSNLQILKYWHFGLGIAVALHACCYLLSDNYLQVRAGVFVEGNHGGSYYLLSFFLMWFAQQKGLSFGRSGVLLSLTGIALSQSSAAIILWLPLSVLVFLSLPRQVKKRTLRLTSLGATLALISAIAVVYGPDISLKLMGEELDPNSFSRYDRLSSAMSGINMFLEHPIFGVGIQGYAFALPEFVDPFINQFFDWNSRRIANNIYIELLAEQGAIGFLAMLLVIFRISKQLFHRYLHHAALAIGAISIFIGWLAFPTYTISFQWVALAIFSRLALQGVCVFANQSEPAATYNKVNIFNYNSPTDR